MAQKCVAKNNVMKNVSPTKKSWEPLLYSVFHRFRHAKFANGVSIKAQANFPTVPAASKNDARHKIGQNWLKNNHLTTLI